MFTCHVKILIHQQLINHYNKYLIIDKDKFGATGH